LLHLASSDPRINIEDTDEGGIFQIRNTSGAGFITTIGNSPLVLSTNSTERARIDSSGRLLIGTSTAVGTSNAVIIKGTPGVSNASIYLGRASNASTLIDGNILGFLEFGAADGGTGAQIRGIADGTWSSTSDCPTRLEFSTTADGASSPTERVRIGQNGYLKASNTGSYIATSNAYHELVGNAGDELVARITNTHASSPYGVNFVFQNATPNNATNYFINCADSTADRATIRSNGGLANYSANNVNLSDRNAKKDITLAAGTWDCLKEWEIVNFRYKDQPDDADLNMGVIAQQVAESCPEVISVFQEATQDQPEKLGVKDQQMMWMAIKALQEAQLRIETLEAEVAALKAS
jgi:hypothetical protein